jgi:hypothetical protein
MSSQSLVETILSAQGPRLLPISSAAAQTKSTCSIGWKNRRIREVEKPKNVSKGCGETAGAIGIKVIGPEMMTHTSIVQIAVGVAVGVEVGATVGVEVGGDVTGGKVSVAGGINVWITSTSS